MPSKSIATIPGDLVLLVRSGAYADLHASLGKLRALIEGIHNLGTIGSSYKPIEDCLAYMDGTRALLDVVGWTHFPYHRQVEVDLPEHQQALRGALNLRPPSDRDHPKGDLVKELGTLLTMAGVTGMADIITIPVEAVALVRSGVFAELNHIAGDIASLTALEGHEEAAERYTEPYQREDAARALLNVVGWEVIEEPVPVVIDLHRHRGALLCAAHHDLDHQVWVVEHKATTDAARVAAEANRTLLEELIAAAGEA
jgi:hypothetical protein